MLRGSPVGDDIDSGCIDEVIAVFSRFLFERVHEDLQIRLRDLPDEFSRRIVVQIDHLSPLSPCPLLTFVFALRPSLLFAVLFLAIRSSPVSQYNPDAERSAWDG